MANILIYSNKTNLALELVSAARLIGGKIYGLSLNQEEQATALSDCGVHVLKMNNPQINLFDTAELATILQQAADKVEASIILLSSDKSEKHLAGRLAERLQAGCLTDVGMIAIQNNQLECTRNALGGATLVAQTIKTERKIIALSPKCVQPAGQASGGATSDFAVELKDSPLKLLEVKDKNLDAVDIEAAEVLIVVGLGVEDQAQLADIEEVAKKIGAQIACSKPIATDKKWLSEARIIGISGKKCKPNLAILLGISGQVQFYVGIRDAKTLVAINNDKNAAICSLVDYTLVADIKDVIPKLKTLL